MTPPPGESVQSPDQDSADAASPTPADPYLDREAAGMAAEDQERSARSASKPVKPPYRDSPMRPPPR